MMLAILLTAVALGVFRFLSELWAALDDTYYFSAREIKNFYDAGTSPQVFVDIFTGRISVVQATDDKVAVMVRPRVTTKESQAAAGNACFAIRPTISQEAGVIRITATRPPGFPRCRIDVDVELRVPYTASLDLHTRHGDIWVGQAYVGAYLVRSPTAIRSIKARADFDGQDWTYQGDIFVETAKMPVGQPMYRATTLELDGVRNIEISASDALVQARAHGGTFTVGHQTTVGRVYSDHKVKGTIGFVGTLSEGSHSFWGADGVSVRLPAGSAFALDAEAQGGSVANTLPMTAGGVIDGSRLRGVVGANPKASVKVRVDDGSIEIGEKP
jgi:hypothetical protein